MTSELIKCPHCGYKFWMDIKESWDDGKAHMSKGMLDFLKNKPEKCLLDIKCPNIKCGKTFEYEVKA